MMRNVPIVCWLTLACLGLLLSGCGSNDTSADTYPVKGKVTVDGAPLPSGRIFFEDVPKGITNSADIVNGEYSGQAAAGDLKARVVKTEKTKNPMGLDEEAETEVTLKSDFPVTIQTSSNTLPTIEITSGP